MVLQHSCIKFVFMGIIRKTKSVELLLGIFSQNSNALSVVNLVKKTKNQMNKTTVYRILERMESEGVVHSFNDINGNKWYAKCHSCSSDNHLDSHPHFQCKDCGAIECLSVEIAIPKVPNFQIDSAEIMLVGTCRNCSIV